MNDIEHRSENWAKHGVEIDFHHSEHECIVEGRIPAGISLPQHEHDHDHLSILASGIADVEVDGVTTRRGERGPECLTIKAGSVHTVTAVTDAVWYCVWGVAAECLDDLEQQVLT